MTHLLFPFFEAAAHRWPDRTAIEVPPSSTRAERRTVSYASLAHQCHTLARHVRSFVTHEDSIVVLLLPRDGEHLYVSQLAVLKAGAAFACIDPAFPDSQVRSVLHDARPIAVLTDAAGAFRLRKLYDVVPVIDVVSSPVRTEHPVRPLTRQKELSSTSLAYLIYTSGTTGEPKGVMIEHRSIVNLVRGDLQTLGVTPDDRVAQSSSPAYDSSIEETWFALAAGATLVVMDDEAVRLGPDIVSWLRRERISMFCPPPTLLRATGCREPARELPDLRFLHPGGEALAQDISDRWAQGRRLVNDYGPTEATITALRSVITPGQPVTIGRPVPGMRAWVLDENLDEVPNGKYGELCLGGIGLARGYHNAPELTAAKFPEHPRFGRIYRTGDLCSRNSAGDFYCHGRLDTQVKVRGYRIELEAIEARLSRCPGIREAVCAVQGEGTRQRLVGFVTPEPGAAPIDFDEIRVRLGLSLPPHMVPALFDVLDTVPRSTSGKLNRRALPLLGAHGHSNEDAIFQGPRDNLEAKLASAFRETLGVRERISVHDDFFNDLGGDSLSAATTISVLRGDPDTASVAVRDLYEARTVARLAKRAAASADDTPSELTPAWHDREAISNGSAESEAGQEKEEIGHPVAATIVQALWLLAGLLVAAPLAYLTMFDFLPALVQRLGVVRVLLLAPAFYAVGLLAYAALTVTLAVLVKKLLIGTYRPLRATAWGSFYVRNWIVQRCVRLVPWRLLEMSEFQNAVLRALGARIGRRVHFHRGVDLRLGGWDLLQVGDNVTVGQDALLELVTLEGGQIVIDRVTLDDGATLEVRAGVGGNTTIEADAALTPWSFLPSGGRVPAGERWDGVPARPIGRTVTAPDPDADARMMGSLLHGALLVLGRLGLTVLSALPWLVLALTWRFDEMSELDQFSFIGDRSSVWLFILMVTAIAPTNLLLKLAAIRLLGRFRPGVICRWSPSYIRLRLKTEVLESAGRWLCGTLLWPVWLRAAGMSVGPDCEISTIIDTVPELVEIGPETFLADGIHLAGPTVSRGMVTLGAVQLGSNVFLGNHSVVGCGQRIPDDVLIGVSTVADGTQIRSGTSWFGHPPFELHNRERVVMDRRVTHEPGVLRYVNRVFWEMLRFALPLVAIAIGLAWFQLARAAASVSTAALIFGLIPLLEFGALAVPAALVVILKWLLLMRVRPDRHPLWSCWCSRWDFLYVVWDFCATVPLSFIDGTLLLNAYLRAMGVRVGRRVLLSHGFVHVADPDMLRFDDDATASNLMQAHTFEDRVLKLDYVTIGRGATVGGGALLLYGADLGDSSHVVQNSAVMKRERLVPHARYVGRPTRVSSHRPLTVASVRAQLDPRRSLDATLHRV